MSRRYFRVLGGSLWFAELNVAGLDNRHIVVVFTDGWGLRTGLIARLGAVLLALWAAFGPLGARLWTSFLAWFRARSRRVIILRARLRRISLRRPRRGGRRTLVSTVGAALS